MTSSSGGGSGGDDDNNEQRLSLLSLGLLPLLLLFPTWRLYLIAAFWPYVWPYQMWLRMAAGGDAYARCPMPDDDLILNIPTT